MNLWRNSISHYFLLTGLYFLLVFALPANKVAMATYHLSALQYHILLFVVVLPILGIWFAAFYGFEKLKSYAQAIQKTAEGEDYKQLATGCGWLAYALPIPALVSIILNTIANSHPRFHPTAVIISNYINLIMPLIAFSLLSNSARSLTQHANVRLSMAKAKSIIVAFATLGVVYCYFIFRNFDLISISTSDNAYFLPVWLAVISIVIPYLYSWFVGLLAAYEIVLFAQASKGIIYRHSLQRLGYGIAAVIVSSITLQYLSSIIPKTGSLSLNYIVAWIYVIQIISAIGYTLIAIGAARLKRIEEV
ncbi:MAG: hypothetical protein QFB87_03670 [Patescibacteria group bacterium]|nr:hypothetical protein [Patescibacteria group bacterium]